MALAEDIFALACVYTQADEEDREGLQGLCAAAQASLSARLRRDVSPQDCYDCFATAAALLAAADFTAVCGSLGVERFTAGPVSVSRQDAGTAQSLRQQAAFLMAPWCQDAFCFMGV